MWVLWLFPVAALASVSDIDGTEPCPACGSATYWSHSRGGEFPWGDTTSNRDLRGWSLVGETYFSCDSCLFTGTLEDLRGKLPPDLADTIRSGVLRRSMRFEGRPSKAQQCMLAAEVRALAGGDPHKLLKAYLNYVWALRIQAASDFELSPGAWERWLGEDAYDFERDDSDDYRKLRQALESIQSESQSREISGLIVSTLYYAGEYDQLLWILPRLHGLSPDAETQIRSRQYSERIGLEMATEFLERSLVQPDCPDRAALTYLAGELHRRMGHYDEARVWYGKALRRSDLNPTLRAWIPEQMALLRDWTAPAAPEIEGASRLPWVPVAALVFALSLAMFARRRPRLGPPNECG